MSLLSEFERAMANENVDLSEYPLKKIEAWIRNYQKQRKTEDPFYLQLLSRREELSSGSLSIKKSVEHLISAAKAGVYTTYGDIAKASGMSWSQARYSMNNAGGHLDQILDYCHAKGLPLLTAICVNQASLLTGQLQGEALKGFIKAVNRLGTPVQQGKWIEFLNEEQQRCFNWGDGQMP